MARARGKELSDFGQCPLLIARLFELWISRFCRPDRPDRKVGICATRPPREFGKLSESSRFFSEGSRPALAEYTFRFYGTTQPNLWLGRTSCERVLRNDYVLNHFATKVLAPGDLRGHHYLDFLYSLLQQRANWTCDYPNPALAISLGQLTHALSAACRDSEASACY